MKDCETNKEIYLNWTVLFYFLPLFLIILPFIVDKFDNGITLIWSTIMLILFISGLNYIYYFLSSKPVLTLTRNKLYYYRARIHINWSEIQELKIVYRRGALVLIKMSDNEKYLSLIDNSLLRLIYRIRLKLSNGIFYIDLEKLKGNNQDIFSIMNTYLIESKQITK